MSIAHTALQWKFTACQYNIENANGFKTFSMSKGLTEEEKDELVQYAGAYTRPDDLPDRPTKEELEKFPVAFASFRLRSGKYVAVQTTYVGQDYAGVRWGNFFSHALIFTDDYDDFYPIQLWKSSAFEKGLTEEELKITTTPPPLPPVEITEEHLTDMATIVASFLDTEEKKKATLSLVNAIRGFKISGKPIVIWDEPDSVVKWIAAIQYAFPAKFSKEIFFSTYMNSATNARRYHIVSTALTGCNFQIRSPNVASMFNVYNFIDNKIPFLTADYPYSRRISFTDSSYPGPRLMTANTRISQMGWTVSVFDNSLELIEQLSQFAGAKKSVSLQNVPQFSISDSREKLPLTASLSSSFDYLQKIPLQRRVRYFESVFSNEPPIYSIELLDKLPIVFQTR